MHGLQKNRNQVQQSRVYSSNLNWYLPGKISRCHNKLINYIHLEHRWLFFSSFFFTFSHVFCNGGCYPTINNPNPDTRSWAFCHPGFVWLGLMQSSHFVLIGQKAVTAWSQQRDTLPSQNVEPVVVSGRISQSSSQQCVYFCVECVAYTAAKSSIYYLLLAELCFA